MLYWENIFWIFEKIPTLGSDTPWGFYLQIEVFFVFLKWKSGLHAPPQGMLVGLLANRL